MLTTNASRSIPTATLVHLECNARLKNIPTIPTMQNTSITLDERYRPRGRMRTFGASSRPGLPVPPGDTILFFYISSVYVGQSVWQRCVRSAIGKNRNKAKSRWENSKPPAPRPAGCRPCPPIACLCIIGDTAALVYGIVACGGGKMETNSASSSILAPPSPCAFCSRALASFNIYAVIGICAEGCAWAADGGENSSQAVSLGNFFLPVALRGGAADRGSIVPW